MQTTIAISYFHRKVGPMVFYSYPEGVLHEEDKMRISDVMDSAFEEGFFTHSFDKVEPNERLFSMNYYFEIFSKWARGQKEMLMISAIMDEMVNSDTEHEIIGLCIDFAQKLKNYKDIFKAFYNEEDPQFSSNEAANIQKYAEMIRLWVKELYWETINATREKSEEEIIASLMSNKGVYQLIQYLRKGPIALDDLQRWFSQKFPRESLDKILKILEEEKIIFINDIGVENYVLLVKDVNVSRIPPESILSLMLEDFTSNAKMKDYIELAPEFTQCVKQFFDNYQPNFDDSIELFELVANPRVYNVLTQLRSGPIEKSKMEEYFERDQFRDLFEVLDLLKSKHIIEEFKHSDKSFLLLITDIQFTTGFPKYLSALIPKETKVQVAKAYFPNVSQEHDFKMSYNEAEKKLVAKSFLMDEEEEDSEIDADALKKLTKIIEDENKN